MTARTLTFTLCLAIAGTALAADDILQVDAGRQVDADITLLARAGKVGRDNPFYDGYRPQARFDGSRRDVTCTVHLPSKDARVDPGTTVAARLSCLDAYRVRRERPVFTLHEGGRKVGEGKLRP